MLLFRIMRNGDLSGTQTLAALEAQLRQRLPETWRLKLQRDVPGRRTRADAQLELTSPAGDRAKIIVEFKSRLDPRDVASAVAQARAFGGDAIMVAAPYLAPRTRELIAAIADGYADATGNLRLRLDRPAVFIEATGADSNPWPHGEEPLRSLKGPAAGRLIRALCEIKPPYGIRELAQISGSPPSTTTRVVALLERDALVTRDSDARIVAVDWRNTILRWVRDYGLLKSNRTSMYIEPRGLEAVLSKLHRATWTYAVTGSLASAAKAQLTAPRLAIVYTANASQAAQRLRLREADAGSNVMLAEPYDRVVFDRTWTAGDVVYAGLAQVAADLLTGPGRGPSEGEELLTWMEGHEDAWRA